MQSRAMGPEPEEEQDVAAIDDARDCENGE